MQYNELRQVHADSQKFHPCRSLGGLGSHALKSGLSESGIFLILFFATYRTEIYMNGGILSKIGGFLVFFIRNARNMVDNNVALFGRACYIVRT